MAVARCTSQNVRKQYFQIKQTRNTQNAWRDVVLPSRCNAFAIARFLVKYGNNDLDLRQYYEQETESVVSSLPKCTKNIPEAIEGLSVPAINVLAEIIPWLPL